MRLFSSRLIYIWCSGEDYRIGKRTYKFFVFYLLFLDANMKSTVCVCVCVYFHLCVFPSKPSAWSVSQTRLSQWPTGRPARPPEQKRRSTPSSCLSCWVSAQRRNAVRKQRSHFRCSSDCIRWNLQHRLTAAVCESFTEVKCNVQLNSVRERGAMRRLKPSSRSDMTLTEMSDFCHLTFDQSSFSVTSFTGFLVVYIVFLAFLFQKFSVILAGSSLFTSFIIF